MSSAGLGATVLAGENAAVVKASVTTFTQEQTDFQEAGLDAVLLRMV